AAVIAIGVLASFGVFNPGGTLPTVCTIGAPLGCNVGVADTTGVTFEMINGAGQTLTITDITVSGCDGGPIIDGVALNAGELSVTTGQHTVGIPCTLVEGDQFNGDITVSYKASGSDLVQSATGQLSDTV
ncbi:hypothetical protein CXX78_00885, partial [Candidatus Parvarchaeota archaeon]